MARKNKEPSNKVFYVELAGRKVPDTALTDQQMMDALRCMMGKSLLYMSEEAAARPESKKIYEFAGCYSGEEMGDM